MRAATARVASRRGSSISSLPPRNHGSSSSAIGTTVLLPAPGGASTTALRWRSNAERSAGKTSSMGRPDFTGRAVYLCANIIRMRWRQSRQSQNVQDYRGRGTGGGGGGRGTKFGIVGLIAIVGAYFLGVDPRLIMSLVGGGTGAPATE